MNDHPWYMRTELWAMVVTFGINFAMASGVIDPDTAKQVLDATGSPEAAGQYVAGTSQIMKLIVLNAPVVAYVISRGMAKMRQNK